MLLLGLLAGPASASALYRCIGSTGETVFAGTTAGYKDCKRLANMAPARPARPVVPMTPAASVFQPVEATPSLKGVIGSVVLAPGHNDGPSTAPVPADGLLAGQLPTGNPAVAGLTVESSVTTTARALGPARVTAANPVTAADAVAASANRSPAAAPTVKAPKGTWDYHESASTDLASLPAPEQPKGSRVLRGAVYRITRADGGVEYTNIPQSGAGQKGQSIKMLFTYIATCAACDVHSKIDWNSVALNITSYGDAISAASTEFGVDEALLRAIIHAESAFNPRALSVAGAQGLMQLIPGTARDMGVLDAFDANQNIRGGARYLALLLRNFNGNERLAAAAYNAGPGAVQKYNGVPPYDETQVYVERVGTLRKRYGQMLKEHPGTNVPLASRGT
ncbi:MAG TPA: lytic transglycosylase domain-containing protein [Luteibacter sp.]|uniref:lytic transglycosylase domain-containing protein n=1 Tax=Luteibacter sp. TaxID=1886636 RepID=UPI002B6A9D2D|nr:lytic transglycosylase domain-containing protein [Luteibacter sp.]HVI55406.1 lytic transglycosylase domain-containing protein [Luteibacter sp.]